MRRGKARLISSLLKREGLSGFSDREIKNMLAGYNLKGDKGLIEVAHGILGKQPNVENYFKRYMEGWSPNPASSNTAETQLAAHSQTAFFRSRTLDERDRLRDRGVEKVRVRAYFDDRTTEICREMHGRIIDLGASSDEELVANYDLSRLEGKPTGEIEQLLPPYHYNCRTIIEPYYEPVDDAGKLEDKLYNYERVTRDDAVKMVGRALESGWSSSGKMADHAFRHGKELRTTGITGYNDSVFSNIRSPGREVYFSIDKDSLNLHGWFVRYMRTKDGERLSLFTLIDLSNRRIVTHFIREESETLVKIGSGIRKVEINRSRTIMKSKKIFMTDKSVDSLLTLMSMGYRPFYHYSYLGKDILEDPYTITAELEMTDRYHIHRLWLAGLVTDEQQQTVRKMDRELIDNSRRYIRRAKSLRPEAVGEFIDWLRGAVEEEDMGV